MWQAVVQQCRPACMKCRGNAMQKCDTHAWQQGRHDGGGHEQGYRQWWQKRPLLVRQSARDQTLPQEGPAFTCTSGPGHQHTCDLPLTAPWPASSQVGRPTCCHYMSGRQSLARLCAARLRAWRPAMQLAAMPSSAESLDRAAMHSTASTSSSAPGDSAAEKETCALPGCVPCSCYSVCASSCRLPTRLPEVLIGGPWVRRIAVTFYDEKDKSEKTVRAVLGQSLMEAAHASEVDLEGVSTNWLHVATSCWLELQD